jgi:uncharacterized Zn finger protein
MKAMEQLRFNTDALRDRAGDEVFERGEAYHRNGHVQILTIEPERVLAQVAGAEDYRTQLTGRGSSIDGHCSCPAFGDWGVCKHMVAVALAVNAAGAEAAGGALSRIRDHLKQKSVDALAEMIVQLAEQDPALFRRLDVAATVVNADDATVRKRLRKSIDSATRPRGYIEYSEAPGWAANVEAALGAIADLASGARAGLALELAEHAIDRIERAIESIDDSDGHCSELLHHARDIHLAAAQSARPDPMLLAGNLFVREVDGAYDTFADAAQLYADVLGEQGLAEYNRLAAKAWGKLPRRSGGVRQNDEFSTGYHRLQAILDFFAERAGDVDARIALRAQDLSSAWRYLQLAQFCESQGRADEALRRAEEGLWVFEDGQPDERLVLFTVELLSKAGRKADEEALLWRAFEKMPSLELSVRIRKLGGQVALERIIGILQARLAGKEWARWYTPAELLACILTEEKMFEAAWAVVRKHKVSTGVRDGLVEASETTHPREALEVYAERVNQFVGAGGNHAYAEAAKLIARMAALQSAAEQAAYVATLKSRHGQKRNFMKLLG